MDLPDDALGDLEAIHARLPKPSMDEVLAALRAAPAPPPLTTIPAPEVLRGGIVRFRCPLGCADWHHEEHPGRERMGPLLLPAGFSSGDLCAAITSEVEVRGNAFRLRVERAIADHFAKAHPGR